MRRVVLLAVFGMAGALAAAPEPPQGVTLFDFEDAADLKAWSNLELPDAKQKEPAVKIERSTDHATSGKHSLKLTFAGGRWPTVTTTEVPADWMPYQTFRADVTVSRPCVVGFTVLQEKSQRGGGWDAGVSRWTKTELLKAGKTEVAAVLHPPNDYAISAKHGKVVRFEIFMYAPHDGETIYVDNIRLSATKLNVPPPKTKFAVAGTDWEVADVQELGKKLKDRWQKPQTRTVDQVEAAFRARFDEVKKTHPKAVLAVLRDGDKGYDPSQPDKVFSGWKDAYWSSHGPDGLTLERAENRGKAATHEVFMRHRSPLMRVELASIPKGANVLAAQLVIVRAREVLKEHDPNVKPTMWVAEPCNRPWEEYEVNAYEYAKDKFWKEVGGRSYGDDPDFPPLFLAYGPGGGDKANAWDFTEAVKFWTEGKHANHGFMLHGDSHDYITAWAREAPEVKDRPALLVIYEPK
jgi:hypothetical protein